MSKSKIRVGFLTALDPKDKRSWSGIYFRMWQALQEEFETVKILGPVQLSTGQQVSLHIRFFFSKVMHRLRFGKKYNVAHNHTLSKKHGAYFSTMLQKETLDVIFAPTGSVEIAYLQTPIPICYYSDATFDLVCNYYEAFQNLSPLSIRESNEIELLAIQKSKTHVFSSRWAIESAKQTYGAKNTHLVKMGANLDREPEIQSNSKNNSNTFSILFVGVDWKRKGGAIVLDSLDILQKRGFSFQLTVVGCDPEVSRPYLEVIPFLDKNKREDAQKFENLLHTADIFFMPSRADCTPIAFCEANAYGLPVISTKTGGIEDVIENQVNGILVDYDVEPIAYADLLENLIKNPDQVKKMSQQARQKYEEELNWKNWAKQLKKLLIHTANH